MTESKELILEDAIRTAIDAEKKAIKWKRVALIEFVMLITIIAILIV